MIRSRADNICVYLFISAVVSVQPGPRQEFSPAAQAAAAAATGQPLQLAQPGMAQQQPQFSVQYMPQMGPPGQQIQMVPMASTRMMTPPVQPQQAGGHLGAAGADQSAVGAVQQPQQHQHQQQTVFGKCQPPLL